MTLPYIPTEMGYEKQIREYLERIRREADEEADGCPDEKDE